MAEAMFMGEMLDLNGHVAMQNSIKKMAEALSISEDIIPIGASEPIIGAGETLQSALQTLADRIQLLANGSG